MKAEFCEAELALKEPRRGGGEMLGLGQEREVDDLREGPHMRLGVIK